MADTSPYLQTEQFRFVVYLQVKLAYAIHGHTLTGNASAVEHAAVREASVGEKCMAVMPCMHILQDA